MLHSSGNRWTPHCDKIQPIVLLNSEVEGCRFLQILVPVYQSTRCHIPLGHNTDSYRCGNSIT
jgi:hypothetical protein